MGSVAFCKNILTLCHAELEGKRADRELAQGPHLNVALAKIHANEILFGARSSELAKSSQHL